MAWGLAYLFAAVRPASRVPVMLAGGAGKLVYFLACLALFSSGAGKSFLLAAGIVDLVLAALFFAAVLPRRVPTPRGGAAAGSGR